MSNNATHTEQLITEIQRLLADPKHNSRTIGEIIVDLEKLLSHGEKAKVQKQLFPNDKTPRSRWRKFKRAYLHKQPSNTTTHSLHLPRPTLTSQRLPRSPCRLTANRSTRRFIRSL